MAKEKKHSAKKTLKIATFAMAIGAIVGAAAGMMNAPKKGKEVTKDLEKEAAKLWKSLKKSKKDVHKTIKKVYGEVSPQAVKTYTTAKTEILARVMKYKDQMTKSEYEKIVASVMNRLKRNRSSVTKKQLTQLEKEFKTIWKDIKKAL